MIQKLTLQKIGQQIRDDGPESHQPKAGTPTMGGALILARDRGQHAALGGSVATASSGSRSTARSCFGVIGFVDDYKKLIVQELARPQRVASKYLLADRRRGSAPRSRLYFTADKRRDVEHRAARCRIFEERR